MKTVGVAFIGVSGLCWAVHNLVMIAADHFGAPLLVSIALSFVIVVVIGYVGHSLLTFRQPMSPHGLLRYGAGMVAGTLIAIPIIWFWKVGLDLPMVVAAPAASVCTIAVNFVLTRWAILRPASLSE